MENFEIVAENVIRFANIFYPEEVKDDFVKFVKVKSAELLHSANREDIPMPAVIPFLEYLRKEYQLDILRQQTLNPENLANLSKEKTAKKVNIQNTTVELGSSEYDLAIAQQKNDIVQLEKETKKLYKNILHSVRKMRRNRSVGYHHD